MSRRSILRPARFDDLGLRRALSDRLLPALVAAMTFLAALTLAGVVAAASLAGRWQSGAASVLTVQVPQPAGPSGDGTRLDHVVALLRGSPGVNSVRVLSTTELAELLRPWLGNATQASALPLPAVIEVRLVPGESKPDRNLQTRISEAAPGTFLEGHGVWLQRLTTLARSLQLCAAAALLLVGCGGRCRGSRCHSRGVGGAPGRDRDRAWPGRHRRLHRRPFCLPRDHAGGDWGVPWRRGRTAGAAGASGAGGPVHRHRVRWAAAEPSDAALVLPSRLCPPSPP